MPIKRGDLFWADLNPARGSEQSGRRPILIIQNNIGNEMAPTIIAALLTTTKFSREYPTNVFLPKSTGGLKSDSTVLLSQIRTIDKTRLAGKIGSLPEASMHKINEAIKISLALPG